jgi:hypothetical protein
MREFQIIVNDEWPSMSRLRVSVTPHSGGSAKYNSRPQILEFTRENVL